MLIAFIDRFGLIHQEFLPNRMGITGRVYLQVIKNFRESMRRCHPLIWRQQNWGLLQDNASAHISNPVQNFLLDKGIPQLPHPGYSPNLTPLDYWFFSRVKSVVKGIHFHSADDLKTAVDNAIATIPAQEFSAAFDRLVPRLRKCIQECEEYFERESEQVQTESRGGWTSVLCD